MGRRAHHRVVLRLLVVVALVACGLLAVTGGAGATAVAGVTGVTACFGGQPTATGCTGGSTSTVAGQGDPTFEVGFTTPVALDSSSSITLDASSGAPGLTFTEDQLDYTVSDSAGACALSPNPATFANGDQTVTLPIPSGCPAAAGDYVVVTAFEGDPANSTPPVTNPATAGVDSVQVSTTADPAPTASTPFTITSVSGAPTDVEAANGSQWALLSWTAPTDTGALPLSGYDVYCGSSPTVGTSGTVTTTTDEPYLSSAQIATPTDGSPYYCVVTAVNADGQSAASAVVTMPVPTVPGPPSIVYVEGQNGGLVMAVSYQYGAILDSGAPISAIDVFCSASGTPDTSGPPSATAVVLDVDFPLTGLTNGTPYTCVAIAVNGVGPSAPSAAITATPEPTPPGSPTGPSATGGDGSVTVSWSAPTDDGGAPVTGYQVFCSSSGSPTTSGTPSASVDSPSLSATVTGLTNGTQYTCAVTAVNATGPSGPSAVAVATPGTVPDPPTGVISLAGSGQVTLSWVAPGVDGGFPITGYDVYCATSGTPSTTGAPTTTVVGSSLVAAIEQPAGTQDTCVVTALNTLGQSAASAVATPIAPPSAPTGVTATPGPGQITVNWTPPADDGNAPITLYAIYCAVDYGPFDVPFDPVGPDSPFIDAYPDATSAVVSGLTDGDWYQCVVLAQNAAGTSVESALAAATPAIPPGAPTGLTATPGVHKVTLSWAAPAETGSPAMFGYEIHCVTTGVPSPSGPLTATSGTTSVVVGGLTAGVPLTCLVVAYSDADQSLPSATVTATPEPPPGPPGCSTTGVGSVDFPGGGYWLATADGEVASCGSAPFLGSPAAGHLVLAAPIVGIAATPDHQGYWLVAADGGLFAYGDAGYYGSMGGRPLAAPIVGIASTPAGGYYEVASDGGIFAFGPGAAFHGSMGGHPLNRPVVGMTVTPAGGYYEVASDGGIFAFGPGTPFEGSMGGHPINRPVVGMAVDGPGYYEVASDGGIFAFGVPFHGSTGCLDLARPIVAMAVSPDTATVGTGTACGFDTTQAPGGYRFVAADGGVFSFGNAPFAGSLGGTGVEDVVGLANS